MSFVIAQSDYFGFGFMPLMQKLLYKCDIYLFNCKKSFLHLGADICNSNGSYSQISNYVYVHCRLSFSNINMSIILCLFAVLSAV